MEKGMIKGFIAKRAAKEFKDGDFVNLGIGLPTMVANCLPEGVTIVLHSENGFTGLLGAPEKGSEDVDVINSGGAYVTYAPYGNFFGSEESFSIIRGGHVDATVLGAMEVDEKGNIANWIIPGKMVAGMGGAIMSMGYMSSFNTNMTAGRGFIALAAEAMGRGEPIGTMLTSLLFGFADALANNMQSLGLPQELYTPLFAVARISGWSAHRMEELSAGGKLIRPRYECVEGKRPYIPMEER